MSLWNPYAFSVTGQALAPVAPPALRAYGAEPTAEQRGMAQTVYVAFCSRVRLSAVPNPTEQGRFPDGTSYRITVVGPQTVMEIWPVADDDLRRSGIGLILTALDGGLVAGHIHEDGDRPQPYILTPRVKKRSRTTTGKWRVRKVDGYSGGKAVWMNKAGKAATVGVGGAIYDMDLLDYVSIDRIFGTNNRAYWAGEYNAGVNFFTDGEKVLGSFRDRNDTIPFFRTDSAGKVWVMQLTPAFVPEPRIQLWGEEYTGTESTLPVGVLLDELPIPSGYTMIWQTISVSPDGRAARMMFRKVGAFSVFGKVDLSITENRLLITSIVDSGGVTPGGTVVTNTGAIVDGNGTTTRVETVTSGRARMPGGYGYGPRGDMTDFELATFNGVTEDGTRTRVTTQTFSSGFDVDGRPWSDLRIELAETENLLKAGYSVRYGTSEINFRLGYSTVNRLTVETEEFFYALYLGSPALHQKRVVESAGVTNAEDVSPNILFISPLLDFHVVSYHGYRSTERTNTKTTFTTPPSLTVDDSMPVDIELTAVRRITATYKGAEVLNVETLLPSDGAGLYRIQYVASAAVDPLTGAACVNILEIDTLADRTTPPLRSWIILVDDVSAKHLHEVMDVPESTAIRVRKDYSLLSVV